MNQAWLRFYEELNDFLPAAKKKQLFPHSFTGNPSVKDMIESLGVPHPEVDMILMNGESVDFSRKVIDGDQISVYPVFESMDISAVQHLRGAPLRHVRIILDVHLGKLARYMRLLGFDSAYDTGYSDNEIVDKSLKEKRIILTRDKILLRNRRITHGYWIRATDPKQQLSEVVSRLDLSNLMQPFTRCMECNSTIIPVEKEEIADSLPLKTREFYNDFRICPGCSRIYWEGSHYEKMRAFVNSFYVH